MRPLLLFIPYFALFACQRPPQGIPSTQQDDFLIQQVHVLSMLDTTVSALQDVWVKDGQIAAIAPTGRLNLPKGTPIVQGNRGYLMPGLADMHVHLPSDSVEREAFLLLHLMAGVTHLRSMRGASDHIAWRDAIEAGERLGPHLYLASKPIRRNLELSNAEIQALFEYYKAKGFDAVKILSVPDSTVFEQLVAASQKYDLPLCGHVDRAIGLQATLGSAVYTSIEHLGGYVELLQKGQAAVLEGIEQTAAKGVYNCATLDYYDTYAHDLATLRQRAGLQYVPHKIAAWEQAYQTYTLEKDTAALQARMMEYTKVRVSILQALHRAGAPLVISPDATGPFAVPGFSLLRELQLHERAGIARSVVLQCATREAAALCGDTERGILAVGKVADLLLLEANPLEQLAHIERVQGVVVGGRWHSRAALEARLKQVQGRE